MDDEKAELEPTSRLGRSIIWGYRLFPLYLSLLTISFVAFNSSVQRWTGLVEIPLGGRHGDLKYYLVVLVGLVGAFALAIVVALANHRGSLAGLKLARIAYVPLSPSLFMVGLFGALKANSLTLFVLGAIGSGAALMLSVAAWSRRAEAEVWRRAEEEIRFVADESVDGPVIIALRRTADRLLRPSVAVLAMLTPLVIIAGVELAVDRPAPKQLRLKTGPPTAPKAEPPGRHAAESAPPPEVVVDLRVHFALSANGEKWLVELTLGDTKHWVVAADRPRECADQVEGVTADYVSFALGDVEGRPAAIQFRPDSVVLTHDAQDCSRERDVTPWLMEAGDQTTRISGRQSWRDGVWTLETEPKKTWLDHFEFKPVPGGVEILDSDGQVILRPTTAPDPVSESWGCLENSITIGGYSDGPTAIAYDASYIDPCDPGKVGDWIEYEATEMWVESGAGWELRHYSTTEPSLSNPLTWLGPDLRWRAHRDVWTDTWDWEESEDDEECGFEVVTARHQSRWEVGSRRGPWTVLGVSKFARDWRSDECSGDPDEP